MIKRLWTEDKVDFQGRFYKAKGAVVDPKPVQKPHPPLLFGGVSPRMLRMAGQYSDLCYIPPWTKVRFSQAKSMVEHSARKNKTSNEIAFGAGSPTIFGGKFDLKALAKDVQTAIEHGCKFYVTAFPQDEYVPMMRRFSREIIPSFKSQTRLANS